MAKRADLVGRQNQKNPLAGDPLGILLLNGHLSEEQVHAAWRFAILRWRLYGKPFPAAARIYDPLRPKRGAEPAADPAGRDRYEKCCEVLKDCGRLTWQEVRNTAMEQRLPAWFLRLKMGEMRNGDQRRQEALRLGLDALAREFGISANAKLAQNRLTKTA